MARSAPQSIEMNFDGLTDSVTNLTGTLILVALLLIGMTTSYVRPAAKPKAAAPNEAEEAASRPMGELLARLQTLQGQLASSDAEIKQMEQRLEELQDRYTELTNRAAKP